MFTLKNDSLTVSILDPVADRDRFGTRYCTGGYIFQVADDKLGNLLSGPTYPDSFNWFDGQGIPDAFNKHPLADPGENATTALIIGIGMCDLAQNKVTAFCEWDVQASPARIAFQTSQSHQTFGLAFTRTVSLEERTVRSHNRIVNTGKLPIPINWFPHPFYPQPNTDALCKLNIPVTFPENPGFEQRDNGFISRKGWPWTNGFYQALNHTAHTPLTLFQKHPVLGLVGATCSYVPSFFPIWGNPNTFSWEPFYERTLAPNQETTWWIDYEF
jgi:hypothetical protein